MHTLENLTKRYYSISEVAEMFQVNNSLIRYYEAEFSFFNPHKRNGERRFTQKDIADFSLIHNLIKERGFTLEGAAREIKTIQAKAKEKRMILRKLVHIRTMMTKMRDDLEKK